MLPAIVAVVILAVVIVAVVIVAVVIVVVGSLDASAIMENNT